MAEAKESRAAVLAEVRDRLGARVVDFHQKSPRRCFVEVAPADVPDAARLLFHELGARFQIATGVDTPSCIEVLYHWAFDRHDLLVVLRTRLDREQPEIESIVPICVAAEWIEREMWELLGIRFRGHPDLRHLLLADEWPEGKYPLRRDYEKDH